MGVLKKGFNFTGVNNTLRRTLIVLQFCISVFLIIYTVIIIQQMHYMQTKDLGYDKEQIVVLPIGAIYAQRLSVFEDAITQVPGVESVTASRNTGIRGMGRRRDCHRRKLNTIFR